MTPKLCSLSSSFLLPFLLLSSPAAAHNITAILNQFPGFSDLNRLLTQTQLASEINHHQTITVLTVNNAVLSSVSGQPADVVKKILMLHVVLDYYDKDKLQQLPHHSAILTTLLQSSGLATGMQGFLNVTATPSGRVAFRSVEPGSPVAADLVKVVAAQPFNISVLQISKVIVPPGFTGAPTPSPAPSEAEIPMEPPIAGGPESPMHPPVAGGPVQPPEPASPPAPPTIPVPVAPAPSTGSDSSSAHRVAAKAIGHVVLVPAIFFAAL